MLRPATLTLAPGDFGLRTPGSLTVVSSVAHRRPHSLPGSTNVTSSWCALNSSRKLSSRSRLPRGSGSGSASPFRKTPSDLAKPACQSSSVISAPSGRNHEMSDSSPPKMGSPSKNRRRQKTGCWFRKPTRSAQKARKSRSGCSQSSQESSLSWQ
jgi:hypothetical protein